jgi:hypothetical protein
METFGKVVIMGEQLSYCYGLDEKMQRLKRKIRKPEQQGIEADVNKELEYAESLSLKFQHKANTENIELAVSDY